MPSRTETLSHGSELHFCTSKVALRTIAFEGVVYIPIPRPQDDIIIRKLPMLFSSTAAVSVAMRTCSVASLVSLLAYTSGPHLSQFLRRAESASTHGHRFR